MAGRTARCRWLFTFDVHNRSRATGLETTRRLLITRDRCRRSVSPPHAAAPRPHPVAVTAVPRRVGMDLGRAENDAPAQLRSAGAPGEGEMRPPLVSQRNSSATCGVASGLSGGSSYAAARSPSAEPGVELDLAGRGAVAAALVPAIANGIFIEPCAASCRKVSPSRWRRAGVDHVALGSARGVSCAACQLTKISSSAAHSPICSTFAASTTLAATVGSPASGRFRQAAVGGVMSVIGGRRHEQSAQTMKPSRIRVVDAFSRIGGQRVVAEDQEGLDWIRRAVAHRLQQRRMCARPAGRRSPAQHRSVAAEPLGGDVGRQVLDQAGKPARPCMPNTQRPARRCCWSAPAPRPRVRSDAARGVLDGAAPFDIAGPAQEHARPRGSCRPRPR